MGSKLAGLVGEIPREFCSFFFEKITVDITEGTSAGIQEGVSGGIIIDQFLKE